MNETASARPRPSRTWWILALAVVPVLAASGWALLALSRHPENESDRAAAVALFRVTPAVEQALDDQAEQLARLGAVVARDPKFYAVLTLPSASRGSAEFREALEGVLREFQRDADAPVFAVTDPRGKLLGRALEPGTGAVDLSDAPFVRTAVGGKQGVGYLVEREQVYRVATVPISAGGVLVGTLTLGRPVDAEFLGRLRTAMESDVTLALERDIAATTLVPSPLRKSLAERLSERTLTVAKRPEEASAIPAGGRRYLALRRALDGPVAGGRSLGYVLTRPLGSDASPLAKMEQDLLRAAGIGLALALVCGAVLALGVVRERRARERTLKTEAEEWAEHGRRTNGLLSSIARRVLDPAETVFTITDLVADGALGDLSAPQREGVLAIRRASRGLALLAQDLSAVASLEAGDVQLSKASVEIGNMVEQAATAAIPVASERRQMVELSVEPGLVHPGVDEAQLSRVIEALTLHVMQSAPDATKVILSAGRSSGGIEVQIAGPAPEGREPTESEAQELAPWMARLVTGLHGGEFRITWEEGVSYRIWLPLLDTTPPSHMQAPPSIAQLRSGSGLGLDLGCSLRDKPHGQM
jgi:signal transduction histidine kinase